MHREPPESYFSSAQDWSPYMHMHGAPTLAAFAQGTTFLLSPFLNISCYTIYSTHRSFVGQSKEYEGSQYIREFLKGQ